MNLEELIVYMVNHGSSLTMNWGEDTGGYEVDWITGGKRFHTHDRSLPNAMRDAIQCAGAHFGIEIVV